MPPPVALTLALILIAYGFVADSRLNREVSSALWIPFLWLILIGTRYPSQWLEIGTPASADALLEGSPLDRVIFLALYIAALWVLARRRVSFGAFAFNNAWLVAFLAYGLVSILWSDYPFTALKRWTKVIEHGVMVLVVLSDPNRAQAIDALLRRFTYFAIPLSVLFIKYYPELGRSFEFWTGQAVNSGVTVDKNALGHICLVSGVFLIASYVARKRGSSASIRNAPVLLDAFMIGCIIWLLSIANAKTAIVCFLTGVLLVVSVSRTRIGKSPTLVMLSLFGALLVLGFLEYSFGITEAAVRALGRNLTLTDRTIVWAEVLSTPNNFLLGTGFESFWLGPRLEGLWSKYWWRPNQAHNGYIETYINLGAIGVGLMIGMIIAAFAKILNSLATDPCFGSVRLALLVAILILNYTDATFKALHTLYFIFFLIAIDYPWKSGALRNGAGGNRRRLRAKPPISLATGPLRPERYSDTRHR